MYPSFNLDTRWLVERRLRGFGLFSVWYERLERCGTKQTSSFCYYIVLYREICHSLRLLSPGTLI